jgi:hypothetical protein
MVRQCTSKFIALQKLKTLVMQKLFFIVTLVGSLFITNTTNAQTADEVVNSFITAAGGAEKLRALKTVRMDANMSIMEAPVSLVISIKQDIGSRTDIYVNGTENFQLVTPTNFYSFMPIQGQNEVTEMPKNQHNVMVNELDLQSPLLDYATKGHTITLVGKANVNNAPCFELKVAFKNGVERTYFINSTTYRIEKISRQGANGLLEVTYTDYKQDANGYWFAYTVTDPRGTRTIGKVETNVTLDDALFKAN